MGLRIGVKSCSTFPKSCSTFPKSSVPLPAPDPANFTIKRTEEVGDALVVMAQYPDCTNYEGKKIMVFPRMTTKELLRLSHLDPHFQLDEGPVARFEPTERGWDLAIACAKLVDKA